MEVIDIDIIAIVVALVLSCCIRAIWYSSLLFGEIEKKEEKLLSKRSKMFAWIATVLLSGLMAFSLAVLLAFLGATSTLDGIYVAVGLWLGFFVPMQLYPVIWVKRSLRLFSREVFFWLVNLGAMGAILAA